MAETVLNHAYPSLQTLTSIIVQRAVKAMICNGYSCKLNAGEGPSLTEFIQTEFEDYPWEPDSENVRLQVMRELEFIGFSW